VPEVQLHQLKLSAASRPKYLKTVDLDSVGRTSVVDDIAHGLRKQMLHVSRLRMKGGGSSCTAQAASIATCCPHLASNFNCFDLTTQNPSRPSVTYVLSLPSLLLLTHGHVLSPGARGTLLSGWDLEGIHDHTSCVLFTEQSSGRFSQDRTEMILMMALGAGFGFLSLN